MKKILLSLAILLTLSQVEAGPAKKSLVRHALTIPFVAPKMSIPQLHRTCEELSKKITPLNDVVTQLDATFARKALRIQRVSKLKIQQQKLTVVAAKQLHADLTVKQEKLTIAAVILKKQTTHYKKQCEKNLFIAPWRVALVAAVMGILARVIS